MIMQLKKDQKIIYATQTWLCFLVLISISIACKNSGKGDPEANGLESEIFKAAKDSAYVVEVTAADYAFGMPTEVPSGWVTFKMNNMGQETHNGIIYRYSDSITYKELIATISQALQEKKILDPTNDFNSQIETAMGGPAILSPGLTGETTVLLEPGIYALTCWMVAADGEYHLMKGMTRPFVVTQEDSGAEKPEGTVDITLEDFAINIEDSIGAGDHVFNVHFRTKENVHLAKLEEGQELEDLKLWMNKAQSPSPFTFLGGAEQAPVGMTNTFKASLEPGRYALVTYGTAMNGMTSEIVVPEKGKAAPVSNEAVNAPVTVRITPERAELSEGLHSGRTLINFKTTEEKQGFYILNRLKDGSSPNEFIQFVEDVHVYERKKASETNDPSTFLWSGVLGPEKELKLNLDIKNGIYMLTGPLPPKDQMAEQWKGDEMYHVLETTGAEASTGGK